MSRFVGSWRTWAPAVAVVLILLATWLLVPRSEAPFIYAYF